MHQNILTSLHHACHAAAMRTTLNIDDEILEAARLIAAEKKSTIGAVLSDLARRGLRPAASDGRNREGFPVFKVSPNSTVLSLDRVKRFEDEL